MDLFVRRGEAGTRVHVGGYGKVSTYQMYEHVSNSTLSVFIKTRERESRKRVKEDKEEKEEKLPMLHGKWIGIV